MYLYTDKRREIHPRRTERFPRERGFRTLRPKSEARGQSQRLRGAKSLPEGNLKVRGGCVSQYISPLGSVRIQYNSETKISINLT